MNDTLKDDVSEPSAEALFRYQVISRILTLEQRGEKRSAVVRMVSAEPQRSVGGVVRKVSRRTLYRWLKAFEAQGFNGLVPAMRRQKSGSTVLEPAWLDFFSEQKNLDPITSIPEMIRRARELGLITAEERIDRTTVWRTLKRMEVSTTRRRSTKKDRDKRRFAYPHRLDMVLCDGKHFRAGAARLRRVAMFFLDDATRMGLGVVVGTSETAELFLRGLYENLLKYGLMSAFYVDKGSGFIANDTLEILRKLNVLFIHGTAGYPEGRGKIEKFNQTALDRVLRTLDGTPEVDASCSALELRLRHFLFEQYNHTPHEGIGRQTPWHRFHQDERPLRFKENKEQFQKAFTLHHRRLVSKDNVVSFRSNAYEIPRGYADSYVTLYYQVLDRSLSFAHRGRLVRLNLVDLHANAYQRRAPSRKEIPVEQETRRPLPKSSAQIAFEREMRPLVDQEGGFSEPDRLNPKK